MSERRDGQQNAASEIKNVSRHENETKTETKTKTQTKTDSMLKIIMTATPASASASVTATATVTVTATAALTTVNAQNKCATAAPTTFSYQRAAKRCARLEQTKAEAKALTDSKKSKAAFIIDERATTETTAIATTASSISRLSEQKAQLRAAFFQDLNAFTKQQQQLEQQTPVRERDKVLVDTTTKNIQQLIDKFQAMIVQQPATTTTTTTTAETLTPSLAPSQQTQVQMQLKPTAITCSAANSDEGCNAGGLSPCSSDNECDGSAAQARRKPKVTRCASSDSALGLEVEVDDVNMMEMMATPQRRMTLTVTDLPLRPALLPLAEPTALPDSPLTSPTSALAMGVAAGSAGVGAPTGVGVGVGVGVPTKVLLEERVVAALSAPPGSRRESTQSCISELGGLAGVRYVRTPSVVVSDYSDDITACGISMEEMEYFRLQRARCQRRCSLEASAAAGVAGSGKDDGRDSDVSAASSCSNLYYCGSTISALDGGECIVNGIRVALARKSSHGSSSDDDEELEVTDGEQQQQQLQQQHQQVEHEQQQLELERERERERELSELLAGTQLGDVSKKVGSSSSRRRQRCSISSNSNDGDNGGDGSVTNI